MRGGLQEGQPAALHRFASPAALAVEAGKDVRAGDWTAVEIEALNKMQLLTAKPMVYLVNLSEKDYIRKANKFLPPLADWLKARGLGDKMIPFSA